MLRRLAAFLTAVLLPAFGSAAVPTATAFQINPGHDGATISGGTLALQEQPAWTFDLPTNIYNRPPSYPLIVGGRVFVVATDQLFALNGADGSTAWGPIAVPDPLGIAADNGRIYVLSRTGSVSAYNQSTGAVLWSQLLPGGIYTYSAAPTALNNMLFVAGGSQLLALDGATGTQLWAKYVSSGDDSSPASDGTGVYVSYSCNTYAYDLTGNPLWYLNYGCSGGGGDTSIVKNGRLYQRSNINGSHIYDATNGTYIADIDYGVMPAIGDTTGYFVKNSTSVLTAVDLATRTVKWTYTGGTSSAPILIDNTVIIGAGDTLYGMDGDNGTITWRVQTGLEIPRGQIYFAFPYTGLASGEGLLVVPTMTKLLAFKVTGPPAPALSSATGKAGGVELTWTAPAGAATYNIYMSTASGKQTYEPVMTGVTGTTAVVPNLTAGTTYYFKVKAVGPGGISAASNERSATPHDPFPPTNLVATAGIGNVTLAWAAASEAESYSVYAGTSAGGQATTPVATNITATQATISNLTPGTKYYFVVKALSNGVPSVPSNEASAVVANAAAPANFVATAGIGSLDLSWTASVGATAYDVYVGTSSGGEATTPVVSLATGTSSKIVGLAGGIKYYVAVHPVVMGVDGPATETSGTPLKTPAPTGLTLVPTAAGAMLTWAASQSAASYSVYLGTICPGGESTQAVWTSTSTNAVLSGLPTDKLFCFVVRANGAGGQSDPSAEVSTTTLRYAGPSSVTAVPDVGQVKLSWNYLSANATQFAIYMGTAAGQEALTPVTRVSGTTATITGLSSNNVYYFFVQAETILGTSLPSPEVSTSPALPPAPTNLTAQAGTGQASLSWSASSGATSYSIYMRVPPATISPTPVQSNITGLTAVVTGVTAGTQYGFIVRAETANGTSGASNEALATPTAPVTPPSTPPASSGGSGGGGGGGGAFDWLSVSLLALLATIGAAGRRRRRA